MPVVVFGNISCESPPYLSNPVPPNEKPFCPNQYPPRVVSWHASFLAVYTVQSSCGGPSHYVAFSGIRIFQKPIAGIPRLEKDFQRYGERYGITKNRVA